jgi:hypothetical protein
MDILFELFQPPKGRSIMWPPFMVILLKRILESGFVSVVKQSGGVFIGGMKTDPDPIVLTEKGRSFIEELGLHEL